MTLEQLNEIADQLAFGFKCYIHKKDRSHVFIPDEDKYPDMELWEKEIEKIESDPAMYIEIEAMDSRESFRIMEDFIDTVSDAAIQDRLTEALQRPKPFQNFKFDIDRSGPNREKWFEFKKSRMIQWVKSQIEAADL